MREKIALACLCLVLAGCDGYGDGYVSQVMNAGRNADVDIYITNLRGERVDIFIDKGHGWDQIGAIGPLGDRHFELDNDLESALLKAVFFESGEGPDDIDVAEKIALDGLHWDIR